MFSQSLQGGMQLLQAALGVLAMSSFCVAVHGRAGIDVQLCRAMSGVTLSNGREL